MSQSDPSLTAIYNRRVTRDIATALAPKTNPSTVTRRWGIVNAINVNATVDVDISGVIVGGVHYVASYVPTVGDRVLLDAVNTDVVVVGTLAPSVIPYPKPLFVGTCTTALTVINGITPITLDHEDYDSHGWHSTAAATERYTPTIAGWYEVRVFAVKDGGWTTGNVAVSVLKNGAQIGGGDFFATALSMLRIGHSKTVFLNGTTDYVSAGFYQDSGSSKTLTVVNGASAGMEVRYDRPNV